MKIYAPLLPLSFLLLVSSCKKTTEGYNFTYSGTVELYEDIHFEPTGTTEGSTYLWTFGDGSTSTEKNPTHVYTKVPYDSTIYALKSETITLTVNGDESRKVIKELQVYPNASLVAGNHSWTGGKYVSYIYSTGEREETPAPDTSFAITYVSSTSINLGGEILNFNGFSNSYGMCRSGYVSTQISYDKNYIYFAKNVSGGLGGSTYLYYKTHR